MRIFRTAFVAAVLSITTTASSFAAGIVAYVDISSQTMTVTKYGFPIHTWKVSTARTGYSTPTGQYRPQRLARMWYSKKYDNSPMPYSVFYSGGFAIHGTNHVKRLGTPASHGCVRLQTTNAERFFNLVKEAGRGNTRIVITR